MIDRRSRSVPPVLLAGLLLATAAGAAIPVRGRVVDPEGRPARARIVLEGTPRHALALRRLAGEGYRPRPLVEVATRADGTFTLDAPAAGFYDLRVEAEGGVPLFCPLQPLVESLDVGQVEAAADLGLDVLVLGPNGQPLAGAWVVGSGLAFPGQLGWQAGDAGVRTNAEGRAHLPADRRSRAQVAVIASGLVPAVAEVEPGRAETTVRLAAGREREVRVIGDDGSAVAGAALRFGPRRYPLAATGGDGAAHLVVVPEGLEVNVLAADGRQLVATVVPAPGVEPSARPAPAQELRLEAVVEVTGRVVSAEDGSPIPGALAWSWTRWERPARSDAQGAFSLSVDVGDLALGAAAPGRLGALQELHVEPGTRELPSLVLAGAAKVVGAVVDREGHPQASAEVVLSRPEYGGWARRTATGAFGGFTFDGLEPRERYQLEVRARGFAPAHRPLAPPLAHELVTIVVEPGSRLVGRIVGPGDVGVAGAELRLEAPPGSLRTYDGEGRLPSVARATTAADGGFAVADLASGFFRLRVSAAGYAAATLPGIEVPQGGEVDLGTLELVPAVTLDGRVVDHRGEPLEGIPIGVASRDDPDWTPGSSVATKGAVSGPGGRFSIPGRRPGEVVDLSVSAAGFAAGELEGVMVPPPRPVEIVLDRVSRVSGRVVGPDDRPVAGARVSGSYERRLGERIASFSVGPSAESLADGSFVLDVVRGGLALRVAAEGFAPFGPRAVEAPRGEDVAGLVLRLERPAVVIGTVRAPEGRGLGGVTIEVARDGAPDRPPSTTTDGEGGYRLGDLAPGPLTLVARAPGRRSERRSLALAAGDSRRDVDFELGPAATVSGRVVGRGGEPVAGAAVRLLPAGSGWDWTGDSVGWRPASSDGGFRFDAVSAGAYDVVASAPGHGPTSLGPVVVEDDDVGDLELALAPGATIHGSLAGAAFDDLASARVVATGGGRRLAGQPTFEGYRVADVPPGRWQVAVALADGRRASAEGVVEAGADDLRLDLELGAGLTLAGRVTCDGEPLAGAIVALSDPYGDTRAATLGDGSFSIGGLEAGRYRLEVLDLDSGLAYGEAVDLAADRSVDVDLSTAAVAGQVVDAETGEGLDGARVTLEPLDDPFGYGRRELRSDERGRFDFGRRSAGAGRLGVRRDGYAPSSTRVEIGPGDQDLVLPLERGTAVGLRIATVGPLPSAVDLAVLDAGGEPLFHGSLPVGHGGVVELPPLPPGRWRTLVGAGGLATVEVAVETAASEPARVALVPAAPLVVVAPSLRGRQATVVLLRADGSPVASLGAGRVRDAFLLAGGQLSLLDLAPGSYRLVVDEGSGEGAVEAQSEAVETVSGRVTTVALD